MIGAHLICELVATYPLGSIRPSLVTKLQLGNAVPEAPASRTREFSRLERMREAAIQDYFLAYSLNSNETAPAIALARLQAGCPNDGFRNGQGAVENATNMCARSNWNDWVALSVLGAAFSETGDFDNALKYARLALDLAPDNEKQSRQERIAQYENRRPFRIPETDPATGLPIKKVATIVDPELVRPIELARDGA